MINNTMFFAILVLIIALFLAGTAGWFSIVGLMAIFASSPYSIAIMAAGLESAKLVTASWLYRNWKSAPAIMKYPLTMMVIVLMLITSLGIFGFLSKSHIEQGAPVGNNVAKIERLDQKITREQKELDDAQSVVLQLDNAVKVLQEYDRIRGPEGAIAVRKGQKEERADLKAIIDEAQENIDKFEDERFELQSTVRAFEVEVGPIKYVADMIYGDKAGKSALESAVRWLIMVIIFVFDPLAVLLLIAANYSLIDYGLKKSPEEEREAIREKNSKKKDDIADKEPPFESFGNITDKSEHYIPRWDESEDDNYNPVVNEKLKLKPASKMEFKPAEESWDEEEANKRMDIIGQNGNTGDHYDEVTEEVAKTDDKVVDNEPRGLGGIRGWLINNKDNSNKES